MRSFASIVTDVFTRAEEEQMRATLQIVVAVAALFGCAAALAETARDHGRWHAHAPRLVTGRLVAHPAWSFACMTRDRATRALPCDQPVWVYGSPCEVDLGRGRYRACR